MAPTDEVPLVRMLQAAMMYGLLFVMAGICSFLATWGIIIFAIFIVEGTTSIYYFLLWSLLNVRTPRSSDCNDQ